MKSRVGSRGYALLATKPQGSLVPELRLLVGPSFDATSLEYLSGRTNILAAVPYRQVVERGFECIDDQTDIVGIVVEDTWSVGFEDFRKNFFGASAHTEVTYKETDLDFAGAVDRCVQSEIGKGQCSNVVLHRTIKTRLVDNVELSALRMFSNLIAHETGYYRGLFLKTEQGYLVGASPEQHLLYKDGSLSMTAISGTKKVSNDLASSVTELLNDKKEQNELFMVVDEELKMMCEMCDVAPKVTGPHLRVMSEVIHTEFSIDGRTKLNPISALRLSMFAPTVVGSPLENAMRVIARTEHSGRKYYSGVFVEIGSQTDEKTKSLGQPMLDSSILIRFAQISTDGGLDIRVGSTITKDSVGRKEAEEATSKAKALLNALDGKTKNTKSSVLKKLQDSRSNNLEVISEQLSDFWQGKLSPIRSEKELSSASVGLFIDFEDRFSKMWEKLLLEMGLKITVRSWESVWSSSDLLDFDFCILGPGPGDPRKFAKPRQKKALTLLEFALQARIPCLAVCFSHQVLCILKGFEVVKRDQVNQGTIRKTLWCGREETAGFYNSFEAHGAGKFLDDDEEISYGPDGEIDSIRFGRMVSVQFHPESILTKNGPAIIAEALDFVMQEDQI